MTSSQSGRHIHVAGNWKMHGSLSANRALIEGVLAHLQPSVGVSVFCPHPYLSQLQSLLANTPIAFGAQDVSVHKEGAYTGEVSAQMLRDFGAGLVLVGHSERRQYHAETSSQVAAKAKAALQHGIVPIVCVGETLAQRKEGDVVIESVIAEQLDPVIEVCAPWARDAELSTSDFPNGFDSIRAKGLVGVWPLVIAYEPVWAIGTGVTASPEEAQAVHAMIRNRLKAMLGQGVANTTLILYGGSVKPNNAETLFMQNDIDGGLIGGAALSVADFSEIIRAGSKVNAS